MLCFPRFCWQCVQAILNNGGTEPRCPDDNELLTSEGIFKDKCAEKEILVLECACPKNSFGCRWSGKFSQLQAHESECPFARVKCLYEYLGCKTVVFRYQLAKHIENECAFKIAKCPYCFVNLPEARMKEHLEKCPKFPVKCPHGCDKRDIPREHVNEHTESCPKAPVRCGFSSMGCRYQDERLSLEEHVNSSVSEHLVLTTKEVENISTKVKNLELQLSASREMNKAYEAQLSRQIDALAEANQAILTLHGKLAKMEDCAELQRKSLDDLRRVVETIINKSETKGATASTEEVINRVRSQETRIAQLEATGATQGRAQISSPTSNRLGGGDRRLEHLEHSLTLHDIQLADQDLKIQILETTSHDGSFLWKIDDYSRRFREALEGKTISLYSPPFFTSRYGYKLCARLYLNGDGIGKGRFISLFIVIMRGEYDGLLSWPFRQKITMRLLDQEGDMDVVETFRPDPNSSSFQRPRSDMNIASGCPQFCSQALLKSRGYLRGDSVFIKIIVDNTDVPMI